MTILEAKEAGRKDVGWIGADPTKQAKLAFEECGFRPIERALTEQQLHSSATLAGMGAVLFIHRHDRPSTFFNAMSSYVRRLLDYDCRVFVVTDDIRGLPLVYKTLEALKVAATNLPIEVLDQFKWQATLGGPDREPPFPNVSVYPPGAQWSNMAQLLLRYRPGPAPNENLKVVYERRISLKPNPRLLKRAFEDCSEVHLVPLTQGNSGLCVYRAHPMKGADHLTPLFVKAGERRKIMQEFRNYQVNVEQFLPFHLGPRLSYSRCCLGSVHGLLVGDLIDASEPLAVTARGGRAGPAIACLFDKTLTAWYRSVEERSVSVANCLRTRLPSNIPPHRLQTARSLGSACSLAHLKQLFMRCNQKPTMFARIHNDLHVNNVMVRGHEALVLDFFAHKDGPILLDVATMEASLLVEGFEDARLESSWMTSIRSLYDTPKINMTPRHGDPRDPYQWFHDAVRQLRHHALRLGTRQQYAGVLALALLTKAQKDPEKRGAEDDRRAAAFVFAEKLLQNNFGP